MNLADGYAAILQAVRDAMQPDPELQLDVWSEQHVTIPKGSAFAGPYRLAHTPYARRVLQCLSPGHPCARVVVRAASQMLKTQVFINAAMGWIDGAPANILALEPTDKLAKRLSARVSKAIDSCAAIRGKVARPRSRDARNTIDCKEFDGGALYITTAGAAANLAEIPARYVFADEVDRMEMSVNNEGDPVELAEARTTTYEGISKAYHVSSPTITGASKIDALHEQGIQERYHVPCPHCGHLHELVQEHFHYDYDAETDRVARAWFVCPGCGCEIEESAKHTMLPDEAMGGQARWVATAPGDGETVSFHINAFYAPPGSITWVKLARQHARALARAQKGDDSSLQVYRNTRLAASHDNSEATTTVDALIARAPDLPSRVIPDWALVLTMAADTQDNRIEAQVEAWGPGMQHAVIHHEVIDGDPAELPTKAGSVWQRLDALRATPFQHASGARPIPISAWGIDSGGHFTQDVYNYGAPRRRSGCVIIKGASKRNRPIISGVPSRVDIDWRGTRTEGGAELWLIGTDVAKDYLHKRLHLTDGAGAYHLPKFLPREWFEGFLSEKKRIRYVKGFAVTEWFKQPGDRNEPLDLAVYNLAIAHKLGLHRYSDRDWQQLRAKLVPDNLTPDLFSDPAPAATPLPASETQDKTASSAYPSSADSYKSASVSQETPAPAPSAPAPAMPPASTAAPQRPATARRIRSRGIA